MIFCGICFIINYQLENTVIKMNSITVNNESQKFESISFLSKGWVNLGNIQSILKSDFEGYRDHVAESVVRIESNDGQMVYSLKTISTVVFKFAVRSPYCTAKF